MITILAILITWYVTKVYYTKTLRLSIYDLEQHDLVQARCHKCAQTIVTHKDNLRAPFYCMVCK